MLGLCYILYRESRLTLTLTACPRWFVLCPVWSSPFDKLLAGSHFLHVESAYAARPDCHLCGLTQGEFFSRLVFFSGTSIGQGFVQHRPPTVGVARGYGVLAPWTPYAPMCGLHQSDGNHTFDESANSQVRLLPLCCKATEYPF